MQICQACSFLIPNRVILAFVSHKIPYVTLSDPGPKPALQQLQRTPEDVIQQCTASIETPLKNETYRHDRQDYINGATGNVKFEACLSRT